MNTGSTQIITEHPTRKDIEFLTTEGQIFSPSNIKPETLDRILANSCILSFEPKVLLYDQGVLAKNLDLYVILSGEFAVWHIYAPRKEGERQRKVCVATDYPGDLAGDVEMLLRTNTDTARKTVQERELSGTQTWARRVCAKPAKVLAIDIRHFFEKAEDGSYLLNIDDNRLMTAIARQLALKLVIRTAKSDPKSTQPRKDQVIVFLMNYIRQRPYLIKDNPPNIKIPGSLRSLAGEIGCSRQTVANAVNDKENAKFICHEEGGFIIKREFWVGGIEK